ncbi:MAG TPA: DUF3667 domain-containing protein [Thermoanaerobaculia bacterium]|nr:DUF3667 domain-containing protein [Thermoanaerobaculia bacterium]
MAITTASHDDHVRAPANCTNCGASGAEVYCARCGEKQPDHHDLTVGHVAHEAFHELVHLDSKLFTTLRLLVVKPGFLTAEYFAGRKKRYIAPLRLFLTFFALQFIAYTAYKPAALYSIDGLIGMDPQRRVERSLQRLADKRQVPLEVLKDRIDTKWQKYLGYLQLANIVGVAVVLLALHRKRHFAEHLVFSAHFLAFSYLFALVVWPVYAWYGVRLGPLQTTLSWVTIAGLLIYTYIAQRRFYGSTPKKTVVKTAVLYGGVYVVAFAIIGLALGVALVTAR